MKIEIAYTDGRIDVFDTVSFTAPNPLGKENALTNFELRFDKLGDTGLWLSAHHYDASPSYAEECPDDETPVARRKRGWRFLLAEASEIAELESVAIDGEVALNRILGEMVDVARLRRNETLWLGTSNRSITEAIIELFDALSVISQVDAAMPPDAVTRQCGCSEELVYRLKAVLSNQDAADEEVNAQEENWLEGFEDESC